MAKLSTKEAESKKVKEWLDDFSIDPKKLKTQREALEKDLNKRIEKLKEFRKNLDTCTLSFSTNPITLTREEKKARTFLVMELDERLWILHRELEKVQELEDNIKKNARVWRDWNKVLSENLPEREREKERKYLVAERKENIKVSLKTIKKVDDKYRHIGVNDKKFAKEVQDFIKSNKITLANDCVLKAIGIVGEAEEYGKSVKKALTEMADYIPKQEAEITA